eukprot:TRINITY_DN985_c0_g1_i2.p1 TRINITY_DN985_c0_g1~~TRINITY_DN985_c0_g1_i2.p1  ORF type:complete len:484 (+),score=30.02 TRINITY_DN985_c0_g1_i2:352-1803(+)
MQVLIDDLKGQRLSVSKYVILEGNSAPPKDFRGIVNKDELVILHTAKLQDNAFDEYDISWECKYVIEFEPFRIQCYYNDQLALIVNHRQLLNYESGQAFLPKVKTKDLFQAVALDFSFNELCDCYGLPERPRTCLLQPTQNPYRVFNLDTFDDKYVNQSFYGNIPFIIANNFCKPYNAGLLWLNGSDTFIDLIKEDTTSKTHFVSECGTLEFVTFVAGNPLDLASAHGKIVGNAPMPQKFALGYHQCRWDRDSQKDILGISDKFQEYKLPCDCLWLDIEHTDQKKYFTWNHKLFPAPVEMIKKLEAKGRHLVVIVDPHLKVDSGYSVYKNALSQGLLVMDQHKKPYIGRCWPGKSVWLDYLNPNARKYWADLFSLEKYKETTAGTYIWNDMNEPAIFDSPEGTAHKNALQVSCIIQIDTLMVKHITPIEKCITFTGFQKYPPLILDQRPAALSDPSSLLGLSSQALKDMQRSGRVMPTALGHT